MLKVSHVSSTWFFYFASQLFNNVIIVFASYGFSSFFARNISNTPEIFNLEKRAEFQRRERLTLTISLFNY